MTGPLVTEPPDGEVLLATSDVLLRLVREFPGERLTMADIVAGLEGRAFGLLMLLLALPNCPPMPGIPFLSTVTGTPLAFFAGQLALGHRTPWLPKRLLRQSLDRARLLRVLETLEPYIKRIERLLRHRLPRLATGAGERAAAGLAFVLAVILALPIPGGNLLPAWAILFIALGIIERDGVCVMIGGMVALVALALVALVLLLGAKLTLYLLGNGLF
ncbi:MAG: exopolysaccharide biosynthesis protein [Pseudomonadota bacterium]